MKNLIEKIMTLYAKFEDGINGVLSSILNAISGALGALIPSFISTTYKKGREGFGHFLNKIYHNLINTFHNTKKFILVTSVEYIKHTIEDFKAKGPKEKILLIKKSLGEYFKQLKDKNILGTLLLLLIVPLKKVFIFLYKWLTQLGMGTVLGSVIVGGVGLGAGYAIFYQGKNIYKTLHPGYGRTDKNAELKAIPVINRPDYYKGDQRTYVLDKLVLPVFLDTQGDKRGNRTVFMDITVEFSNRYLILYVTDHEHEVRDFINTNFQPILLEFPLKEEGKIILREKIKEEINEYLKKKKVRGHVKNIFIHAIIVS